MAKYSEEKLIEEIYRVSEEHCDGKRPSIRIMNIHSDISICRYREQFGKWNNAIKETDFQPHAKGEAKYKNKEDVRRALKNGSKKYCGGKRPSAKQIKKFDGVSPYACRKFFGSVANALNKCGFKGKRKKKVSEEKLIEEMINLSKEKNKIPSAYDMKNDGKYTRRTYQKRFGSWNNALEECGFEQFRTFGPPEGENHWYWKGGITSHEYGKSWNKKRNKTLERDDYVCRVCGSENGDISPHVHHIVPRRYWDIHTEEKIMNSLNNLISLCGSCHGQLEGKFKGRNHEEFEELAKDYLDIEEIEEKKGIFDY